MESKALTARECAEIEKRTEAATPGPWSTQKPAYEDGWAQGIVIGGTVGRQTIYGPLGGSYPANDQKFIAASRTDVPALLASYRAAMELLKDPSGSCPYCDDGVEGAECLCFDNLDLQDRRKAERRAAVAAYEAAAPESAEGGR